MVSQSAGPGSNNNDGTSCLPAVSNTDLGIVKLGPATVRPGQPITWTLRVTNHGPANSSGFRVTDLVPPQVSGVSSTDPSCTVSLPEANGTLVTCNSGALGSAPSRRRHRGRGHPRDELPTSRDVVLTGNAPDTGGACVVNSASVLANENDPNPSNNTSADVETCVGREADLSMVKRVSPSPATPGSDVAFNLVVHNHGPDDAERVVVSDPLPAGLSFVSASPGCTFADGAVTCRLDSLANDASASFRVVAHLAASATGGVVNTARVASDTPDSDPSNSDATASTPVGPKADLAIEKSSAPDTAASVFTPASSPTTVAPGGVVSYTLAVTNHGPSDARDVTVSDPLHAGLTWPATR